MEAYRNARYVWRRWKDNTVMDLELIGFNIRDYLNSAQER